VFGNAVKVMRIATGEEPDGREDAATPSRAQAARAAGRRGGPGSETDGGGSGGRLRGRRRRSGGGNLDYCTKRNRPERPASGALSGL
jgi:hypothetical protein